MKLLICTALTTMLLPAVAMATESSTPQSLTLPDTMTISGQQFASRCTDESFAKATSRKWLADQCESWLARWWQESRCQDPANNSRLDCVMIYDGKANAQAPTAAVSLNPGRAAASR